MTEIKARDIVLTRVQNRDKKTGEIEKDTTRVCVVTKVLEDKVELRTLTSRIESPHARLYGIEIPKSTQNGLRENSAVMCTRDNKGYMPKKLANKLMRIGEITIDQHLKVTKKAQHCNMKNVQMKNSTTIVPPQR